jgi:hypothetical protein
LRTRAERATPQKSVAKPQTASDTIRRTIANNDEQSQFSSQTTQQKTLTCHATTLLIEETNNNNYEGNNVRDEKPNYSARARSQNN